MNHLQQSLGEIKLYATSKKTKANAKQDPVKQGPGKQKPTKINNQLSTTLLDLPQKLLEHVAGMIRHDSLGSLANLNVCSSTLYEITLPVLWKEVHWAPTMWKDLQKRGDMLPGWKFVEYIHFSGKNPWFWEGLVDKMSPEVAELGSQDIVFGLWPSLKAIIRTEPCEGVEIPKSVWLTLQGVHHQQSSKEESPIAKLIRMSYQAWHLACGIIPSFSDFLSDRLRCEYFSYVSSHEAAKFWEGTQRYEPRPDNLTPPTPIQRFLTDPDASLKVDACRHTVKRTLDFHILSNIREELCQDVRSEKMLAIWKLFRQMLRYFPRIPLTFSVEGGFVFPDVKIWLQIAQLASENDLGGKVSSPFSLSATLKMPHTTLGLVAESWAIQTELLRKLQEYTANADPNITAKLPRTVRIKTEGARARLPPSCKHADIDLRDPEKAKVVLITQCASSGGPDQKGFLNGRPMAPREFERWRTRANPDFVMHDK